MSNRLILFDCDGTLTNSHALIVRAMQQAFQDCDLSQPSARGVQDVTGLSLAIAIERLGAPASLFSQVEDAYKTHYRSEESTIRLYDGVRETLELLRNRGYWLGVVTGKSKPGLTRVLERLSLAENFYVIRTADCTHSKPHPAMVLESMAEMGVSAERTSVVGDAVFDMQMAAAAGVEAIGVSFGVGSTGDLVNAGAKQVVDGFEELLHCFPAQTSL